MDPVEPYVTFPKVDDFDEDKYYVSDSDKEEEKIELNLDQYAEVEFARGSSISMGMKEYNTSLGAQKMVIEGDLEDGEIDDGEEFSSQTQQSQESQVSQELPFIDPRPMIPQRLGKDDDSQPYVELPRPKRFLDPDDLIPNYTDVIEETEEEEVLTSGHDSDEDNNLMANKRSRYGTDTLEQNTAAFSNPNCSPMAESSSQKSGSEYDAKARELQAKRNVWVNVWSNEEMKKAATTLENFTLNQSKNVKIIDRGPESFSVDMEKMAEYNMKEARHYTRKRRLEHLWTTTKYEEPFPEMTIEDSDYSLSSDDSSSGNTVATARRVALGLKRRPKLRDYLQTLNTEDLKKYIVKILNEKNEQIIDETISLLGSQAAIDLFSATLKVERRGGMLIHSGARKRTPGGVFIYLLRKNKSLDQKLVEEVFNRSSSPVPVETPHRPKRLGSRKRPHKKVQVDGKPQSDDDTSTQTPDT